MTDADIAEVAAALEQNRALRIVEDVRALPIGGATEMYPTPFQAAWQIVCDEIEYRIKNELWELDKKTVDVTGNEA